MSEQNTSKQHDSKSNNIHGFNEIDDAINKAIKARTKQSSESTNIKDICPKNLAK